MTIAQEMAPAALNRRIGSGTANTAPGVGASIDRMRQHVVQRRSTCASPFKFTAIGAGPRPYRQAQSVVMQAAYQRRQRARRGKPAEHLAHAFLDTDVRIEHHPAPCVTHIAARQGRLQFATRRLGFAPGMHALAKDMELNLGH